MLNIYAIKDEKAEAYLMPFYAPNDAVAKRMFGQAVNDAETDFAKSPDDYTLHYIGIWDEIEGKVAHSAHKLIAEGIAMKGQTK